MKNLKLSHWLPALLALALLGVAGCTNQAKAKRHLQRADGYFAAEQYDKAEIEYLNVLKLDNTNLVAIHNLAEIYYADEMLPRAVAFFNTLKKLDPADMTFRGKLARLYLSGGAVKEARQQADLALQYSPTNEEALLVLVDVSSKPEEVKALRQQVAALQQKAGDKSIFHVTMGYLAAREKNPGMAESEFKSALNLEPKSAAAQWAMATLYLAQTNMALAETAMKAATDLSPIRSARRLRFAAAKMQAKDLDGANAILTEINTKAPDYIPAWIYSARMALDQKNLEKCAAALERVMSRVPDHFEGLLMRSEMQIAQGKPQKAISDLERLATLYPKNGQVRYQLALTQLLNKDTPRAISVLNQAVNLDTNLTPAILLLAELNIRKGETTSAINSLNELIARRPKIQRAYTLLGGAYQAAGKLDDALAIYSRAAKEFPTNSEAVFMGGLVLRQQGKVAAARKVFELILQSRPDDVPANSQLIEIDLSERKFDQAADRVQKWMDRQPKDADPIFQMAKVRFAQNDLKVTQELLEKVIGMNPDALPAYFMLARVYYSTKQLDAALEKCKAALTRNPKDISSLLLSAIIHEEKHEYPVARDEYEQILAISPQNFVALNNLSVVYAEHLNDLDKAYAVSRKAEELRPNDPTIADTFGWILVQRGDYSLAVGLLREAAQGRMADAEVISHLGIAQYMTGDEIAARATLERALKMNSTFSGRDQAEASIAFLNINPTGADQSAVARLEKRLNEKPADPVALSRLAAIYNNTGKVDKAVALYEKALAANPKMGIASARLAEINEQRLNNPTKALEFAKNARKMDSDNPQIAHIAGRLAAKSSDLKDQEWGLSLLQESFQKQSGDPAVAYDLAMAYYSQGLVADAEAAMKPVASNTTNPSLATEAKRFLDFLPLADPARAAQSQAQIDQALKADANYLPALAAHASAAQQKGDVPGALKIFDQILSRYPGFSPAIRASAILSATQPGDTAKSLALATRARELFPEDLDVAKALGILQYQRADYPKAARTLADVAKKRPDDAWVQYYLGMSLYQTKQPKESKAALASAVRLQGNATFVADAQKVLKELK